MAGWDADWDEVRRAAGTLRHHPGTMLQVIPSWAELSQGWDERNERELAEWTAILRDLDRPMVWSAVSERDWSVQLDATRRARSAGAAMTAGIHSIPIYTFATFAAPGLFAATPGCEFLFSLSPRERLAALRDPSVRERIRASMGDETFTAFPLRHVSEAGEESLGMERTFRWEQVFSVGAPPARFQLLESLLDTARRTSRHPVDVMLDAVVDTDLRAVFVVFVYGHLPEVTRELLLDPATVISSNDTGAHLMLMAQTQNTHLLDFWARQSGFLTLEQAIHLLSGRQAAVFGIHDRGTLQVGQAADILLLDEDAVGPQAPELVDDLPGNGGSRYICRGLGIERVVVNGRTLLIGDEPTGELPGFFLRPTGVHQ
jgi:N-acyl-D-aspartate/D-glutamate deacylase